MRSFFKTDTLFIKSQSLVVIVLYKSLIVSNLLRFKKTVMTLFIKNKKTVQF